MKKTLFAVLAPFICSTSVICITAVICSTALAFIPNSKFIIDKMVGKGGSGVYLVEQDVIFTGANETLTLREAWQVDGEGLMRVTVRAPKELGDQFFIQNLYLGNQKWILNGRSRQSSRMPEDFFEKFFYYRNRDAFANQLLNLKILAPPVAPVIAKAPKKKPARNAKGKKEDKIEKEEFIYSPEGNVRLARIGGEVAYAFGVPTPVDGEPTPGVWIEQDQFFLRKLRLPSKVEVVADQFGSFARGLSLPQQRTVRWNQKSVQINIVKVTGLPASAKNIFTANSLEGSNRIGGIHDADIAQTVEEFYQRFR